MTILYAPFAAQSPWLNGSPSPKNYPYPEELAALIQKEHRLIQVGGNGDKKIAEDFRSNLSWPELQELIYASDTAVCVDSFLQHAFWYCNWHTDRGGSRRAIVIFSVSDPVIFGHTENLNLLKDRKYLRENQFDLYYSNQVNPQAFVTPEEVIKALKVNE